MKRPQRGVWYTVHTQNMVNTHVRENTSHILNAYYMVISEFMTIREECP